MATVRAESLVKRFGSTCALSGVDLLLSGGITGLLGPNGAGKTTLLRILATVLRPDEGQVEYFGEGLDASNLRRVRRSLGYMPQSGSFYDRFSVHDFLHYVANLKELGGKAARAGEVLRVTRLVELDGVAGRRIRHLSGGMQRRVALAQAMMGHPDLLLLDEPTTGLDPEQRFRFRDTLASIAPPSTILLSTHQTEDISALCDNVIVLDGGAVRFSGTLRDFRSLAKGRVWLTADPHPDAVTSWRGPDGSVRNIGSVPSGCGPAEPLVEDAYLVLLRG